MLTSLTRNASGAVSTFGSSEHPLDCSVRLSRAIVLGLIGISLVKRWWARIWPVEKRSEYAGAFGYYAARTVWFLLLSLVFLPLAGVPAGLWVIGKGIFDQVWFYISLPFRILRWLWRRIVPA